MPEEVRKVLGQQRKWVWFLIVSAGLLAFLEAATLANLLLLGFAVLNQEPTGAIGSLLGDQILGSYSQSESLLLLSSLFIVLVILRLVLLFIYRYISYKWSTTLARAMHKEIMHSILLAPIHLFDEHRLGNTINDVINGPEGGIAAVDHTSSLLSAGFLIGSVAVMLVIISPWLLIMAAIISFLWFFTIVPPIQRRMQLYQQQKYDERANGMNITSESVSGIREIRALASETRWTNRFFHKVELWEAARGRSVMVGGVPGPALQAMLQAGFAASIIFSVIILPTETLTNQIPVLGVFAYGLFRVYPFLGTVSRSWIGLSQSVPFLRAAAFWTEMEEDELAGGTQQFTHPIDVVRLNHVSFSYTKNEPIIVDADFCIETGKVTALVGASGAGKSTIIDLLLKFRNPSHGGVWVGNQNLNDVVRSSWLQHVGLVRQDVFLFAGNIRENLLEYQVDATDEELRAACHLAGALKFIEAMPDGLDTLVGERGLTLSGGQRQRIAIARALLRNSDFLILDEAMSALDGATEAQILNSLLSGSSTRMILLISHRLATVRHADHIIVLEHGQVVEQGSHPELIAKQGKYYELFSTQLGQESTHLSDSVKA